MNWKKSKLQSTLGQFQPKVKQSPFSNFPKPGPEWIMETREDLDMVVYQTKNQNQTIVVTKESDGKYSVEHLARNGNSLSQTVYAKYPHKEIERIISSYSAPPWEPHVDDIVWYDGIDPDTYEDKRLQANYRGKYEHGGKVLAVLVPLGRGMQFATDISKVHETESA